MEYEHMIFQKEDGFAIATMNRPERMNALSPEMMDSLRLAIDQVKGDGDMKALIITGAGRGFCAGADMAAWGDGLRKDERGEGADTAAGESSPRPQTGLPRRRRGMDWQQVYTHKACLALFSLEKPVIAAVNGAAVGGGCDIALWCDIRIASENARFGELYVRRGIIPDEGGLYLLPRLVGMGHACELLFTGEIIDAREAERIGLVNRVVPADQLMTAARELASKIANMPPLAVRMAKRGLYRDQRTTEFERAMHYAVSVSDLLLQSEDSIESAKAFTEKREPRFKGR